MRRRESDNRIVFDIEYEMRRLRRKEKEENDHIWYSRAGVLALVPKTLGNDIIDQILFATSRLFMFDNAARRYWKLINIRRHSYLSKFIRVKRLRKHSCAIYNQQDF